MKSVAMVLVLAAAVRMATAGVYWVEGEEASAGSWARHGWYDTVDKTQLSGGKWLSHWAHADGLAVYRVEIPEAGAYDLWVRGVIGAALDYRVNDGDWVTVDVGPGVAGDVALAEGPRVLGWRKYGAAKLVAGPQSITVRTRVMKEGEQKDWAFGGIDALVLAAGAFTPTGKEVPAGAVKLATLPLVPEEEGWFDYAPGPEDFAASTVDVSALLDKPAGKYGPLGMQDGRFVFANGKRVKFLGTNLCNKQPGEADAALAANSSRLFAKYGINAIRFHKFCHPGEAVRGDSDSSTALDEADGGYLDRMDYFVNECRKNGIYITWSPIYGHVVKKGDGLATFDELMKGTKGGTAGLVNFAPDLQDVHIRLITALLNHKNRYTGQRYAEDPALTMVEVQNEDDIFWNYRGQVSACPTYQALLFGQFSDWLKARYGTDEKLAAAWGAPAIEAGESLEKRNYSLTLHGWWFSEDAYSEKNSRQHLKVRTLDTARFLHETQNAYYGRVVKAIRDTGFKGLIIGSCWHSGGGVGHWYNLRSDALVGPVDRHNYFGGGGGHRLGAGAFNNESMLKQPGSGLLGTGAQQVRDRPFMISEWLTLMPNMWIAEGQAILGAYGMGLQDWDGIFMFASSHFRFPPRWDDPRVYTADQPLILGANPALAYWIYRGDVTAGAPAAARQVRVDDLGRGVLSVNENLVTEGDVKAVAGGGSTPLEAFAVGGVTVEFIDAEPRNALHDLAASWDAGKKIIRSNTGELTWDYSGEGFFTLDTPRSQAVCGFVKGHEIAFAKSGIEVKEIANRFVALYLSELERNDSGARILVTALARARNTGMVYSPDEKQVLAAGGPPMQLEAVRATIAFSNVKGALPVVWALDQHGRRTDRRVPVVTRGGRTLVTLGPEYKTCYYEILTGGAN